MVYTEVTYPYQNKRQAQNQVRYTEVTVFLLNHTKYTKNKNTQMQLEKSQ